MSWEFVSSTTIVTKVLAKKVKTSTGESLYLHKIFINDKCTGYWFSDNKKAYNYKLHYQYATPEFLELIKTKSIGSMNEKDYKIRWEDLSKSSSDVFDVSRICRWQGESHLVFQYGKESPISSVYDFNYITGIADNCFDVDKAYEHLKNHPSVLKCQIEDIPHYNREDNFTRGIRMSVLLPQETIDAMWDLYKEREHPCIRVRDSIISRNGTIPFDPLDIQQFRVDNND